MAKGSFIHKLFAAGPIALFNYLSIGDVETNLKKIFEIFPFILK